MLTDAFELSLTDALNREDEEAAAALSAYQREFEEDHSWEQLQEDEFGHLVAIVSMLAYLYYITKVAGAESAQGVYLVTRQG